MNIAIDIDDTLADTFDYYIPFLAEYFGVDANELRANNISYNTMPPEWQAHEHELSMRYNDRVIPDTPFKPDAAEGVRTLRSLGHKIFIITARTTAIYHDPVLTTQKELANGHIEYDKLICTIQKAEACKAEKIDILIDDYPANCLAAAAVGVHPIVFASKAYADVVTAFPVVHNWTEAVEQVKCMTRAE